MKGKFNKRQKMMKNMSALLALAAGTLGLGMSEFGMMSVLSGAAADLNVSIPQAGHFVAAYALGVCAGALLLIFIARGRPLKKTLLVLAALMTAGGFVASVVGSAVFAAFTVALKNESLSGMAKGILAYWVFLMSQMVLTLLSFVKKQEKWEPIAHTSAKRLEDMRTA